MIAKSHLSFEQELCSLYSCGLPATSLRTECFNKLIGATSERERREKLQLGMAAAPDIPVWLLKQAQEQAMVCLTHGEYVAIGYTSEKKSSLPTIPAHEWSFLELNCERLLAEGGRRTYYGVRILRSANLRKQDWEVLGQGSYLQSGSPGALLQGRLETYYRTSIVLTFGGGANEIQRDIIAMAGLRMPRAER